MLVLKIWDEDVLRDIDQSVCGDLSVIIDGARTWRQLLVKESGDYT